VAPRGGGGLSVGQVSRGVTEYYEKELNNNN